jgi:class 3 adenylate cyclase
VDSDIRFFKYEKWSVAYTVGEDNGPPLLLVPTWLMNIDALTELAPIADLLRRVGSFTHFATFDYPGSGTSDPIPVDDIPGLDFWVGVVAAALDEIGWERASLWAVSNAGPVALAFAARYPERVASIALGNASAALVPDATDEVKERILAAYAEIINSPDWTVWLFPSTGNDPELVRQFARFRRQAMSPAMVAANLRMSLDIDVRDLLSEVRCPVLIVQTAGGRAVTPESGRYLADHLPNATYVEVPGVDQLPLLPEDVERWTAELERFVVGESTPVRLDRVFATVLFTDIVSSTARTAERGDHDWSKILDRHDKITRETVHRFGGRLVKSTGDGIFATLDAPARAVRCTQMMRDALREIGVEIRAGLHAGEVEVRSEDVGGMAVNIARRVCDSAATNEVWVSETLVQVVTGSGLAFDDLGPHELKGVPGTWRLYRARD